ELAERSFRSGLVRQEFALDSNLGARRDRQAMELAGDGLVGPAAMAARIRELADSLLDLMAAGKKQHRIEPAADQHRTPLFPLEVFLADQAAVLARRDPYARSIAVMGDHPVGAEVDPAAVRVARDHDAVGADVATPILLVYHRHRELEQVNGRIAIDVLEDRPVLDLDRRD